jgi:DNA-binding MarR family transcriptional regulator
MGDSLQQQLPQLTPFQIKVLMHVLSCEAQNKPTFAGAYAKEHGVKSNDVISVVSDLIDKGLLNKSERTKIDGNNHYVKLLSLTQQGKNIAAIIYTRLSGNQPTA